MNEEQLKPYHSDINNLWKFMKEFLSRDDDQSDPDRYWQDVVKRFEEYAKGRGTFTRKIFVQGIKELERLKCTKG